MYMDLQSVRRKTKLKARHCCINDRRENKYIDMKFVARGVQENVKEAEIIKQNRKWTMTSTDLRQVCRSDLVLEKEIHEKRLSTSNHNNQQI